MAATLSVPSGPEIVPWGHDMPSSHARHRPCSHIDPRGQHGEEDEGASRQDNDDAFCRDVVFCTTTTSPFASVTLTEKVRVKVPNEALQVRRRLAVSRAVRDKGGALPSYMVPRKAVGLSGYAGRVTLLEVPRSRRARSSWFAEERLRRRLQAKTWSKWGRGGMLSADEPRAGSMTVEPGLCKKMCSSSPKKRRR